MKITDVRITLFRDGPEPGSAAGHAAAGHEFCLVEVVTGSALSGLAVATTHAAPAIQSLGGVLQAMMRRLRFLRRARLCRSFRARLFVT